MVLMVAVGAVTPTCTGTMPLWTSSLETDKPDWVVRHFMKAMAIT
jgi:hypothetical protein